MRTQATQHDSQSKCTDALLLSVGELQIFAVFPCLGASTEGSDGY